MRERDVGDVEPRRPGAVREREEVVAQRPRRVLAAPPRVGARGVGRDRVAERRDLVGLGRGMRVDDADLVAGQQVGLAVDRRLRPGETAPGRGHRCACAGGADRSGGGSERDREQRDEDLGPSVERVASISVTPAISPEL